MAFNDTNVSKLNIYTLPQTVFEAMVNDKTIDADSLYLTKDSSAETTSEIFPYVIDTTAYFGTMQKVTVSVSGTTMMFV